MTAALSGRVAIVTGAATSSIGREHALLLAKEGARVVVNQPPDLDGGDVTSDIEEVVRQIRAAGGSAVGSTEDVSTWVGGRSVVEQAVETFGGLDILVNNYTGWRNSWIADMEEEDWDQVVRIHLKGHFVPLRWATNYWRDQSKAGNFPTASVVNTSSPSGLFGRPGQANYGAAKAGIATLTFIAAYELARYGVRVNAVAPAARITPDPAAHVGTEPPAFDRWDPANVSPLVCYLATEACPATGKIYFVQGGKIQLLTPWGRSESIERTGRWTVAELIQDMGPLTSIL